MKFFTRGKRGDIYLTKRNGKLVVVKRQRLDSDAFERIENEAFWLKKLNRSTIGPRFLSFQHGDLTMEYIDGKIIEDYLQEHNLSKALVKEILLQCRTLDTLQVNKFEMHHPFKHIIIRPGIISRKNVVMVDFERCRQTLKPKNVTQFCQYLVKLGWQTDREKLTPFLQRYKKEQSSGNFRRLLHFLFR